MGWCGGRGFGGGFLSRHRQGSVLQEKVDDKVCLNISMRFGEGVARFRNPFYMEVVLYGGLLLVNAH